MRSAEAVGDVLGAVLAGESVGLKLAPVAVGAVVEGDAVYAEKQSVQPWRVVVESLVQVNVEPADTATDWGPMRPSYRTPATSTKSYPDSVSNSVAVVTVRFFYCSDRRPPGCQWSG